MMWSEGGQISHLTFAGLRGGGGKGGSTTTSGTQNTSGASTTQLPDWVTNAAQGALATGQNLAQQPYQPYTGQIVAGTPDPTQQAYQQVSNLQGGTTAANQAAANQWAGVLPQLQAQTPGATNDLTNQMYGNYQQNVMQPAQGLLGGYLGGPATAQQIGQNTQALMSPYTQSVIDPTNQLMQQQLHQNLQNIGAGANQAGAFGGSRQGVQEGVAQSQAALGSEQYLGNLLNNQWNTALTPATQTALQAGQQGYGAAGTLAGMGQAGYGNAAGMAQNMANTNLGLGTSAAQQIPALAGAQQTQGLQASGALQAVGNAQQQQQQNEINAQMGQFYQQQNWPVQNLDLLLSTLSGVPYGSTTSQQGYTQGSQTAVNNPSIMSQISQGAGLLGMAMGL
jgi:hypothetical protein